MLVAAVDVFGREGRLRIGLGLPNRGVLFGVTTVEEMIELAELADLSDAFDSVWVSDSLLAKPRPEAITLLAAIAARTRRVRIGTACLASFPLRDPVLLAAQWATLDQLAKGRTVLTVCSGIVEQAGAQVEGMVYGISNRDRIERLEEGIDVLRLLWTRDDVEYHGKHLTLEHVSVEPKPARTLCPPIWVAANADGRELIERSHKRIAKYADGWQTVRGSHEITGRLSDIRRRLTAEGRDPKSFVCSAYVNVNVDSDRERAFAETKRFMDQYFGGDHGRNEIDEWCAYGPAAACADYLDRYRAAGVDELIVRCVSWNQKTQFGRLRDDVLPRLRALSPSTST
ncbi:MAG TPA: LLM class flavin-dependent oxidoreductase [Candidatus Dormibacteraeota bacterium]|nr:LLM class flavin-dependent oxidoreductase [Candidatus Dormibacteraeota bacterium]